MDFNKTTERLSLKNEMKQDRLLQISKNKAMRFLDMQSVISAGLAGPQQSVNNAENYPSTWTTNPDGGANRQV